jgi:colanic acid/amylovoran biosynthesis glycosyltransferase
MRVAFMVGQFPSVSEVFILQQIAGLIGLGCDVRIFAEPPQSNQIVHGLYARYSLESRVTYRPPNDPAAAWRFVRHRRAGTPGHGLRKTLGIANFLARSLLTPSSSPASHLIDVLLDEPFDIVHAHFGSIARHCSSIGTLQRGARLVTTFHGYDANVEPNRWKKPVYRELFRRGHAFTVNSHFLERRLVELGCAPQKIDILRIGVDLEKFEFRERHLNAGEPVQLLSIGRLVEAKGFLSAVRAVARLVQAGHRLEYRIIGNGPQEAELRQLIERLGVQAHVKLLGPRNHEQLSRLYHESHLLVLPSIRTARGDQETQGLVVQEAQATGMPVVVSDVGGVREGILVGQSGVSFASGNVEALADCIAELAARPESWPEMGRRGRALVERAYSLTALNQQLLALYERLLRSEPAAQSSRGAEQPS